jgi:hypothetical protein
MKRSGRILLCFACGMALSAVVQANNGPNGPSPASPSANANQKGDMASKIEALKKRLHAKNPAPNFPVPGGSAPRVFPPGVAPAAPSNRAQPGSVPKDNSQGNPYTSIAARNVFGLNPPAPAVIDTPQGPPPPKITLTGITTIFGPREALYKVSGVPQPGKPPKDESYILQEGQGQDDVVVERIDVDKGIVTFNNHGQVQDILLMAGVASGGSTGTSSGGGGGFQQPQAGFGGRQGYNNALQNFRQRLQQQRMGNQNGNNPADNNFNPSGQSGYNNGYNQNSSMPQLSSDDQAALIAAQHAQLQQEGNPMANLFPPTKYDPEANQEAGVSGTDSTGGANPSPTPLVRKNNGLFYPSSTAPPPTP